MWQPCRHLCQPPVPTLYCLPWSPTCPRPPYPAAGRLGLDVPLFSRLLDAGVHSVLLDEQYRMHPAIAAFPSLHFYGGRVPAGVTAQDRPPVQVGRGCISCMECQLVAALA